MNNIYKVILNKETAEKSKKGFIIYKNKEKKEITTDSFLFAHKDYLNMDEILDILEGTKGIDNIILPNKNDFKIGDKVYHSTNPELDAGIIIDILYSARKDEYKYIVSFGIYHDQEVSVIALELSKTKPLSI